MAHHKLKGLGIVAKALALADVGQTRLDVGVANGVEVKALNAAEDGLGNLLGIGRAQHEDHVRGRLLNGLEQRVERRRGEHVHLVDDVHLVRRAHRRKAHATDDLFAHVVDARTACCVKLVDVGVFAGRNEAALLTGAVGQMPGPLLAHERLGQQACHGSLACTARAAEQVRVARTAFHDRALQRGDHMGLPDNVSKGLRAVFCVQRFHVAPPALFVSFQYTARRRHIHSSSGAIMRRWTDSRFVCG